MLEKFKHTKMKSYCSNCNRATNQEVLKQEFVHNEDETGWWDETHYQIIKCMGCDEISFRKLYDDISLQQSDFENSTVEELFPKRGLHSRPIKNYRNLSSDIKKVYRETIDAYNNDLTLLCGIGIRAIIEGICIDKSITEGSYINSISGKTIISKSLDGKIHGLASKGFLTSESAEILHELRFLGNAAVHQLSTPSTSDLSIAIDIIELVIENIYEVMHKALRLRNKRQSKP